MGDPWYNDETVDYTVFADHWPAGGGPRNNWPEHYRVSLRCSVCGRVQSQPPETDLMGLVIATEDHHHRKHGGPDWRTTSSGQQQQ